MNKVIKITNWQNNSIISDSFGRINYADAYKIEIYNPKNFSVDVLATKFFTSLPSWVRVLLLIRDIIVKPFGLAGSLNRKNNNIDNSIVFKPGQRVVFFTVYNRNKNEIVMAEDDKHLNLKTSIRLEKTKKKYFYSLYSSTIVKYNNIWGKIYFTLVKPFHKIIIKTLLNNMAENYKTN